MQQLLILLACLLWYHLGIAQSDFIVNTKGDTLHGKVKYLSYGTQKKVQLTSADGKKSIYPILLTLAVEMGGKLYHPVRTTEHYTYMELLKPGYLSLYAFQLPNQTNWDGRYLLKRDGAGMELPNLGFKKGLTKFLSECDDVVSNIESGEFSKSEINGIIDAYNQCIEVNTQFHQPSAKEKVNKTEMWNLLETTVNHVAEFDGKSNAIEMIAEVKSKIQRGDKIPNFLQEGLKEALKNQPGLKEILEKALLEIQ